MENERERLENVAVGWSKDVAGLLDEPCRVMRIIGKTLDYFPGLHPVKMQIIYESQSRLKSRLA